MTLRNLFALLLVAIIAPRLAFGHGMPMTFHVNGSGNFESDARAYYNPVVDSVEHHDTVFLSGSYTLTGQPAVSALQFTASPATSNPPASNGIALHSTWGFDLVGPLIFWDPVLGVTPTAVTATIVRSGNGFIVDQNSTFVAGGTLVAAGGGYSGTTGFHNSTTVNIPLGSPAGLYAVGYRIRSTINTDPTHPEYASLPQYGPSNKFYAIGTNGLSDADFLRGIEALGAIGVPEPSSVILLAMGASGLAFQGWRRRRLSKHG